MFNLKILVVFCRQLNFWLNSVAKWPNTIKRDDLLRLKVYLTINPFDGTCLNHCCISSTDRDLSRKKNKQIGIKYHFQLLNYGGFYNYKTGFDIGWSIPAWCHWKYPPNIKREIHSRNVNE